MVTHLIFNTQGITNRLQRTLARREICWLIKDRLIPGTPAGHSQAGFSFVRAQVQPTSYDGVVEILSERFEKELSPNQIHEELDEFLQSHLETMFIVPLKKGIELSPLIRRLVFCRSIIKVSGVPVKENISKYNCSKRFWSTSWSENLLPEDNSTLISKSIFNIVHPYPEGYSANVNNETLTNIANGKFIKTINFVKYRSKIASTFVSIDISQEHSDSELSALVRRVASWALPGTTMKGERECMKNAISNTGALSAANTIFMLRNRNNIPAGIYSKRVKPLVQKLIKYGDNYGLSLHMLIESRKEGKVFLGLKKHPRDSELDVLGPPFNPMHEVRKLMQVEEIRNTLPGYKGPYGEREKIRRLSSGWNIVIHRPGFKNCEDFHVLLETPKGIEINPYAGKSPNFETIFKEVRRHLACPHSGRQWLESVFHLWFADMNPEEVITESIRKFPNCECTKNFRYNNEAFLWLLSYLFVEEDMNYRFWYHPPIRGLKYRKQGRDMPMNGILWVAADPMDKSIPQKMDQQTRRNGGLVRRPNFLDFNGPDYLRETFQKVLLSGK